MSELCIVHLTGRHGADQKAVDVLIGPGDRAALVAWLESQGITGPVPFGDHIFVKQGGPITVVYPKLNGNGEECVVGLHEVWAAIEPVMTMATVRVFEDSRLPSEVSEVSEELCLAAG